MRLSKSVTSQFHATVLEGFMNDEYEVMYIEDINSIKVKIRMLLIMDFFRHVLWWLISFGNKKTERIGRSKKSK